MQHARDLFGLPVNADPEVVKAAYKRLARQYHPDVAGHTPENTERMANLNQAYQSILEGKASGKTRPQESQQEAPKTYQTPTRPTPRYAAPTKDAEYERQKAAWMADQEAMAARQHAGSTLQQKVAAEMNITQDDLADANKRTAFLRTLRQVRSLEREGKDPFAKPVPTEPSLEVIGGFSRKKVKEWTLNDREDKALDARLAEKQDETARAALMAKRTGAPMPAQPMFHKAQRIAIQGDTLHIFLGSRGEQGNNIIAAPTFTKDGDTIRMEKTPALFSMNLNQSGKQHHTGAETLLMPNSGMKVAVHFSERQENLRQRTAATHTR